MNNKLKVKASFSVPLFAASIYLLIFACGLIKEKLRSAGGNEFLSVIVLQILVFILPSILFCRLKGVGYATKLNIKLISPNKFGSVIASSLTLILGSILIRFVQIYVFGVTSFSYSIFDSYVAGNTAYDFLFFATAFAIVPALTEEFTFRAIMLTEFNEGGYGGVIATIITSLLSAMMFFTLESLPVRFYSAIVLCLLTYSTGSSLSAFIAHVVFNIYTVFGERYIVKAMTDPSNKIIGIFTFALLFLIVSAITFSEFEHSLRQMGRTNVPTPSYLLKKTDDGETPDVASSEDSDDAPSKKASSQRNALAIEAFFSPTFIFCVLLYAVAIFGFI